MSRYWIFLISTFFFVFGCDSPKRLLTLEDDREYLRGLEQLLEGKGREEALKSFQLSCESGLVAACSALGKSLEAKDLLRLSVVQGGSDSRSVQINYLSRKSDPLHAQRRVLVWETGNLLGPQKISTRKIQRDDSDFVINKLKISGLSPEKIYRLEILGRRSTLLDVRFFKALREEGEELRFVLASCMSDEYPRLQKLMWAGVRSHKPEILFLIGDNIYGDIVNGRIVKMGAEARALWRRYVDHRLMLDLFYAPELIPVHAVWDDHDYGKNNGDKFYFARLESQQIFKNFFSQEDNQSILSGRGVGTRLSLRGQDFYFLDNRSFRDPEDTLEGTHFGVDQEEWLFENLKRRNKRSWIISGDQFFGGYHPHESYERQHSKSFVNFLQKVKDLKSKVVFASGDRHLSEVMRIDPSVLGYESYEITSSALHVQVYPGSLKEFPNPRQIAGVDGKMNYTLINSRVALENWDISVNAYGESRSLLYQKSFTLSED